MEEQTPYIPIVMEEDMKNQLLLLVDHVKTNPTLCVGLSVTLNQSKIELIFLNQIFQCLLIL